MPYHEPSWKLQVVPETSLQTFKRKTKALATLGGITVASAGAWVTLISFLSASAAMGTYVFQQTLAWLTSILSSPVTQTASDLILRF